MVPMTRGKGSPASRAPSHSSTIQAQEYPTPMSTNETTPQEPNGSGADDLAALLEKRKRETSSTPAEEKNRCPHCKSGSIAHRNGRYESIEAPADYFCRHCERYFDEPKQFPRDEIPEAMRR